MPTSSASIIQNASQSASGGGVSHQSIDQNAAISQTGGGSMNPAAPTFTPPFHLPGGNDLFNFGGAHMPPRDYNMLLQHEGRVIADVIHMTQTDFNLAAHGSAQSAAALPGDVKALQMNAQAFVQMDQDIQHHAASSTVSHDYQAVVAAENFTVPLAAGGVGPTGDLMQEYDQIHHILTHDFLLS